MGLLFNSRLLPGVAIRYGSLPALLQVSWREPRGSRTLHLVPMEPTPYLYTTYSSPMVRKPHRVTCIIPNYVLFQCRLWRGELSVRCSNVTSCRQASAPNMPNLSDPPFVLFPWLSLVAVFTLIESSKFPNQQFPWYACHKF